MLISPPPTTNELIDIALTSSFEDETNAAATQLYLQEHAEKKEFRQTLLERLKSINILKISTSERNRLKNIIQSSRLTDRINKRNILGKHISDIEKDANFYADMADIAEAILSRL